MSKFLKIVGGITLSYIAFDALCITFIGACEVLGNVGRCGGNWYGLDKTFDRTEKNLKDYKNYLMK